MHRVTGIAKCHMSCRVGILEFESSPYKMSQDDWDRPVPLEPRWWYPSMMATETTVVETATTTEGLKVQMAPNQVPPEVPVKLLGQPPKGLVVCTCLYWGLLDI